MTFSGRLMPYGLSVGKTGQNRLSFSQLVARGEATPLRGLRAVRNADDLPVGPQMGHSAVKRPDDIIQTEFNELTEQWQRGLGYSTSAAELVS